MERLIRLLKDEQGVTAIEYALIAALIAIVIIAALNFVGTQLENTYDTVASRLEDSGGS